MFLRHTKVNVVEVGELVFFKSIECLRKSKLKNKFVSQEKKFKEITLGYIIGTSTLHVSPQKRIDYLECILNDTLSFLSDDTLDSIKSCINDIMKLMSVNLNFNMGIREYIDILTKKYLSDLDKVEYDETCYNMAYDDLQLYYVTIDKLFDSLSIDYDI